MTAPWPIGPLPHGAQRVTESELWPLDMPARALRLWRAGWNTRDIADRLRLDEPDVCTMLKTGRQVDIDREARR